MTRQELAAQISGRQYTKEINDAEQRIAEKGGLLVVFGASDDLVELRGVIYDEVGAYNGTEIRISKEGKLLQAVDSEDREVLDKYGVLELVEQRHKEGIWIGAAWDEEGYSWFIRAEVPHSTFEIMEDEEKFCRGIVIDLKEAAAA